ncbi:GDSL esterase/lipase At1g71691-like [Magnolia sinica]|uniref:GDSL esterase/lipase At1g71691-like n=1 Tax=Magnolia sinica TaxID=86752 RepID=UPI002658ECD0|nr:GDSL esterase/lipase At1g71691-like [Magnolia sinica]
MAFAMLILAISLALAAGNADAASQVPAMFVFGDSLVDPGNNNNLKTLAKANFYPNGIDFPAGVTGRFCNGGTVADHLGNLLGLPLIPRFSDLSTNGSKILQGVNYASAAAGILDDTGKLFGDLFSMDEQIQNYQKTHEELKLELRSINGGVVEDFLRKSLFFVCTGSNDYLNNYLFPLSTKPLKYTINAFHESVIQQFTRQLKSLYDLGGRKFLVAGLGPLGCIPSQIGSSSKNLSACVETTNEISSQYNAKLKMAIRELNDNLAGAHFLYWDIYTPTFEIIRNPTRYGFKYAHKACCGGGRSKGQILCLPLLPFECQDRSQFVFWDPYHPTDAFNAIVAQQAYQGKLQSKDPMNVQQLIQL